ncbi:MAG TPA: hypothetical protein VIW29_19065, partial [Polyangiaceae bacterium]
MFVHLHARHLFTPLLLLLVTLGAGCGAEPNSATPPDNATPDGSTAQLERCRAPAGVSGRPRTTDEAVQLLNALPKPTTVACFVESLERPLTVFATSSTFSAQPAPSPRSPRVFVRLEGLWLSFVIAGDSSLLIEFGELLAGEPLQSIKGELQLPLQDVVAPSAPYDRVLQEGGTVCRVCHYDEQAVSSMPAVRAFSSIAFRPRPEGHVRLESLLLEGQLCN